MLFYLAIKQQVKQSKWLKQIRVNLFYSLRWGLLTLVWVNFSLPSMAYAQDNLFRMAVTTSLDNSGLLDYLLPAYYSKCDCKIGVLVVGSGQALELARRGDVDMLITHSPQAELEFVAQGNSFSRNYLFSNDFVLLWPAEQIAASPNTLEEFFAYYQQDDPSVMFVSRGDGSGTHHKEMSFWQDFLQMQPVAASWYVQSGLGMAASLLLAAERRAALLADRATYLKLQDRLDLQVVVEADAKLANPYHLIISAKADQAKLARMQHFADWLLSGPGRSLVRSYELGGQLVFYDSE